MFASEVVCIGAVVFTATSVENVFLVTNVFVCVGVKFVVDSVLVGVEL